MNNRSDCLCWCLLLAFVEVSICRVAQLSMLRKIVHFFTENKIVCSMCMQRIPFRGKCIFSKNDVSHCHCHFKDLILPLKISIYVVVRSTLQTKSQDTQHIRDSNTWFLQPHHHCYQRLWEDIWLPGWAGWCDVTLINNDCKLQACASSLSLSVPSA